MPLSPTVAMLPDTPDSRLLAELSSYSDDLSEASDAIEQALEAGHESPLWQPLTSYAVSPTCARSRTPTSGPASLRMFQSLTIWSKRAT